MTVPHAVPSLLENPAEFIRLARVDWLTTASWRCLHAVPDDAWTDEHRDDMARDWCVLSPVRLACGRTAAQVHIPGAGSRMSLPRCKGCCRATGLPMGAGSPKNSPDCRVILGLDAA